MNLPTIPPEYVRSTTQTAAGWIASADTKATALLTINSVVLGLIAQSSPEPAGTPIGVAILQALFTLCAFVSILGSLFVLWPRTRRTKLLDWVGFTDLPASPTFFGDLAKLNFPEFLGVAERVTPDALGKNEIEQCYILCKIASIKMNGVQFAIASFAASLIFLSIRVAFFA